MALSRRAFLGGFSAGSVASPVLSALVAARGLEEATAAWEGGASPTLAPPAADELRRARAKLIGNLLIANQSNSSRVARCIGDQIYGRSANDLPRLIAAIGACEPEAIRSVAERYFDPDRRYEVVVGPAIGAP